MIFSDLFIVHIGAPCETKLLLSLSKNFLGQGDDKMS